MLETTNATNRQARWKASLETQGVRQLNLLAPADAHPILKEIAAQLRAGDPLAKVLERTAQRMRAGHGMGLMLPPLTLPDDLQPGPGEVAVAVRLRKHSSGHIRRVMVAAGLKRSDKVFGWVGTLTSDAAVELRRKVEAAGGTMLAR